MKWIWILLLVVSACGPSRPTTCAEAACDGEREMCVLFGSDVAFEPNVAQCGSLPLGCEQDLSCACVDRALTEGDQFRFCFDAGGCSVNDGVIELFCPGG